MIPVYYKNNFSVESHLNGHLNGDLLRRFNLIVPSDFIKEDGQDHSSMKGNHITDAEIGHFMNI